MKRVPHKKKALSYAKKYGSITNREMMKYLWINSPRDVIYDLKKDGYKITWKDHRLPSGYYYREYFIGDKV